MVIIDRRLLNRGSININIIASGYENHGHLLQEVLYRGGR